MLNTLATFIINEKKELRKVRLNFICTHNSRRSQFSQVWAHYAIQYFKLKRIKSYSGGTEVTAFHRNTIKSLQQTSFKFELKAFSHDNPIYEITYKKVKKPITGFSKLYDDSLNKKPFIAITTCASAEQNCPFIPDALKRFHVGYKDPKEFDNTGLSDEKYLETNKTIAGEMNYLFQKVVDLS